MIAGGPRGIPVDPMAQPCQESRQMSLPTRPPSAHCADWIYGNRCFDELICCFFRFSVEELGDTGKLLLVTCMCCCMILHEQNCDCDPTWQLTQLFLVDTSNQKSRIAPGARVVTSSRWWSGCDSGWSNEVMGPSMSWFLDFPHGIHQMTIYSDSYSWYGYLSYYRWP